MKKSLKPTSRKQWPYNKWKHQIQRSILDTNGTHGCRRFFDQSPVDTRFLTHKVINDEMQIRFSSPFGGRKSKLHILIENLTSEKSSLGNQRRIWSGGVWGFPLEFFFGRKYVRCFVYISFFPFGVFPFSPSFCPPRNTLRCGLRFNLDGCRCGVVAVAIFITG